jgi:hypothetical protein
LYCFHGWSLHEPVLRFGYDNYPQASSIAPDKPWTVGITPTNSIPITPNPILNTNRINITITVTRVT